MTNADFQKNIYSPHITISKASESWCATQRSNFQNLWWQYDLFTDARNCRLHPLIKNKYSFDIKNNWRNYCIFLNIHVKKRSSKNELWIILHGTFNVSWTFLIVKEKLNHFHLLTKNERKSQVLLKKFLQKPSSRPDNVFIKKFIWIWNKNLNAHPGRRLTWSLTFFLQNNLIFLIRCVQTFTCNKIFSKL